MPSDEVKPSETLCDGCRERDERIAELREAAENFVAWANDVWGSAALSPERMEEVRKAEAALRALGKEQK